MTAARSWAMQELKKKEPDSPGIRLLMERRPADRSRQCNSAGSGWDRLSLATVINNNGVIGGSGRFDTQNRGFILIPNTP